ncbi:MAG: FecR family protein [Flavobacteriaceae bacterium]|nr:FecR family protein [Flavobacteriaceae bacterium]
MTENIEKLIAKYFSDELSRNETQELITWIETGKNIDVFNRHVELNFTIEKVKSDKADHSKIWRYIEADIDKPLRRLPSYWKFAVAASITLLISLTFILNKDNAVITEPKIVNNTIKAGTDKATLTLEDGTDITLENGQNYSADNLSSNGKEIVYNTTTETKPEIVYNYLTIPRGGQFFVKLSDGTQVWLNSESKLKYPVAFVEGETRKVELLYGEAYFDVSPSTNHNGSSFKVVSQVQELEVLGTEFNLRAYKDESHIYTTLIEGKVAIDNGITKEILKPTQQSEINIKNREMAIGFVDIYNVTSWKKGIFSFKDKPLIDIMKTLSRWYNTDIIFENKELEGIKFNGVINKKQNIENILSIIKSINNINYKIEDNKIIIK